MNIEEKKAFNTEFQRFLWSSILIALSACLGNVVDSIIVGNLIGEDGVSAINLSKPVIQFMFTISMLLSTGGLRLVGNTLWTGIHRCRCLVVVRQRVALCCYTRLSLPTIAWCSSLYVVLGNGQYGGGGWQSTTGVCGHPH